MSTAQVSEIHPDGRPGSGHSAGPVRWHADAFQDAVWASTLSLKAKALAVTYARHARDENGERTPKADLAWLTYDRAMEQTSIGRRAAVTAAAQELVAAGWLAPVRVVHRRPTVYRLVLPSPVGSSTIGTTNDGGEAVPVVPSPELPTVAGSSISRAGSSISKSGSSNGGTSVVPTVERHFSFKSTSLHHQTRATSTAAYIVERTGADDDEAQALIEKIKTIPAGGLRTTIGAYVRGMPDEDLAELLAEHRTARRRLDRPPDNRPQNRPGTRAAWREDRPVAPPAPAYAAARAVLAAKQTSARGAATKRLPGTAMAELVALTSPVPTSQGETHA